MEAATIPQETVDYVARREHVASFIQNNLQPVGHILTEPKVEDDFEVRDYQLDAWQALWEAREQGEMSALVTLATGLGKTSVGVFDVIKFREEIREQEGREPRVLFVCHQEKILEQASKRFERFVPDMTKGYYTGDVKDKGKDITFATFHSLQRNLDQFDSFEFDYIIYDEAHHSQADTWRRVVKHFNPTFQLALTATPDRMDGLEILDLFGREVYAKGLGEALAEGLLADIDYHIVFDDAVKTALEAGFNPQTLKELRDLLSVPRRNNIIARNINEEMQKIGAEDAKTIVFCNDIAHAEIMAKLLGGKAYHSEQKKSDRNEVLDDFKNGDLQIICTRDMFNEGIDVPDANLLVFLRSTQSKTVFEQQLGRGLRKHEGKTHVSVLDFVGNIERLQEVLDLSNTVSALTSQYDGLDELVSAGDRPRIGGMQVTTSHGSFDFDRLAVDILSTYQSLLAEPAPEGYVSVDAFAREIGTTYSTLKELIAHHQIETGRHKFYSTIGTSLSPEAQEYIRALGGFVDQAPEGYLSAHQFAKEFGITAPYLMKALKGHKITVGRHRFGTTATISFSPEAQQMVRERVTMLETAPEGYVSVGAFAKEIGISEKYLTNSLKRHGIETERHRFGVQPGRSLSPESQEQIRALKLAGEPMPEGHVSVTAFAKDLNTSHQTLVNRIKELGIETERHNFGHGFASTLSPEAQAKIKEAYYPDLAVAPEGYVSLSEFRRSAGIGQPALLRIMAENDLEIEPMQFGKNRRGEGLSPEVQSRLGELLDIPPPAPEGYVSVSAFSKQAQTSLPKLLRVIEEHDIEVGRHRFRTQTVASLSPEAQAKVMEAYNQGAPQAPEDVASITAFARIAGISQRRLKKLIEEHGIKTRIYTFGVSTVGAGLGPEAQAKVRELQGDLPPPPEGYKSVSGFAKDLGTHWNVITKLIKKHGIETEQHQYKQGPGVSLSPEAQQQVAKLVQGYQVPEAPDGYVATGNFAKTHGIDKGTLRRVMEKGEVDAQSYKFGGYRAKGLSPEDQEKLRALIGQFVVDPAPEGYVSIGAFAKSINSSKGTIEKMVKEHRIETTRYRFGVNAAEGLSPEAQEQIRKLRDYS